MTTLQEAAMRKALEALQNVSGLDHSFSSQKKHYEAIESLRSALAQQGEQRPVCAGCGIPAGDVHMSTCQSGKWPSRVSTSDTAAPAPVAQRCTYCDGTGDVHGLDGEWRGTCPCAASPAPQPVGINGLTEAETSASMSVFGLSAPQPAQGDRVADKAWAQFCGLMGEKSPYPGMIDAFERHYAQSFKDKDWRNEASVWAAAWKAALQSTQPVAQQDHIPDAGKMAQPVAQPLTDDEITAVYKASYPKYDIRSSPDEVVAFARAIEAAHGIN